MITYDQLLEEVRRKLEAFRQTTAKEYVPKMYRALRDETADLTPKDARHRIEKDCSVIWEKRTILEFLPDEAKDPEKQKSGRLGQKKRNSAAVTAAPLQQKREIMIDTEGKEIENSTALPSTFADDFSSPPRFDNSENQLNYESDHIQLEFSMPLRETLEDLLRLKACNQDVVWLKVVFDKRTSQVTSATTGEKSRQILDEKSQQ